MAIMRFLKRAKIIKTEKTDKIKTGGGHRPSVLFKYKHRVE